MERISITHSTIVQKSDDEAILVNLESGTCFGLDEIGTTIFELISTQGTHEGILSALTEQYDASPEELARDLDDFISECLQLGLVEVLKR
ncbi:MAG: PqqD family protein [Gammaproteobacteria bacterium]|nr:PqqD family protein [Gammaproteobacteria bacterium]